MSERIIVRLRNSPEPSVRYNLHENVPGESKNDSQIKKLRRETKTSSGAASVIMSIMNG